MSLLHPDDARRLLLAGVTPLAAERVPLADAAGRHAATDLAALLTQPPFDASAMDGWAVRHADLPGPWRIIGEAAAGHGFAGQLGTGETVRIFTGAPLPQGADTVVVQEDMTADGEAAQLSGDGPPGRGAHVRKAGQDFAAGARLISAGALLGARRLGLLAASGHGTVDVLARPRVALLATGDELVMPGVTPGPEQIVNAGSVMLAALLRAAGAEVMDLGILPDNAPAIRAAIAEVRAHLLVTVGGASVGDHDLVVPVLKALGAHLDFWKIAMRPGKPLVAGQFGAMRVLGLPGNPVSAYVCALLFGWPLVRALAGRPGDIPMARARLAAPLAATGNRRDHLRGVCLSDGRVAALPTQDSAQIARLAEADVLIVREAHAPAAETGSEVDIIRLDMFSDVA